MNIHALRNLMATCARSMHARTHAPTHPHTHTHTHTGREGRVFELYFSTVKILAQRPREREGYLQVKSEGVLRDGFCRRGRV